MTAKTENRKKDKEWALLVREKDKHCQVCGPDVNNKVLNSHHLIPKQFVDFRWDIENGMLLCFQHHSVGRQSAHQHPVWFSEWLRMERPEIFRLIKWRIIDHY